MQNVDFSFAQDPNTLMLALVYGMVPAILWLIFWMHEKGKNSKRAILFTKMFIGGALAVIAVLPVQKFIATLSTDMNTLTILWAGSEEVLKFSVFAIFVLGSKNFFEPVDYPLALMVGALAFAGFENALYFLAPLQADNTIVLALAGTTRYVGTTLLHTIASSLAGFAIALAYFKPKTTKILFCLFGLGAGITLHSTYNILIGQRGEENSFQLFFFLWIFAIALMFLYEAVRQMGSVEYRKAKKDKAIKKISEIFNTLCQKQGIPHEQEKPIVESLVEKNLRSNSKEYSELRELVMSLRGMYVGYLGTQGVPKPRAFVTAKGVIPDNASPKAIGGILTLLSSAKVVTSDGGVASN